MAITICTALIVTPMVHILYAITPSMEKVAINRYFKEAPNGFAEIDEAEYKERKEAAKARMEATDGSK